VLIGERLHDAQDDAGTARILGTRFWHEVPTLLEPDPASPALRLVLSLRLAY
jgi:hypothetical protein